MRSLSLQQKMLVLAVFFMLPIVVLLFMTISAYKKDIDFAAYEVYGDTYLRPLVHIMNGVAEHNLVESPSDDLIKKVDESMVHLKKAQASVGEALQFTPDGLKQRKRERYTVETVDGEWKQLKASTEGNSDKRAEDHQTLITDVRNMITHAGDTSNLILDPDLDSYYLMDIVLLALPQNLDRLQQVQRYVEKALHHKTLSSEERAQIGIFAAMLQEADADRISADEQTVLNEDGNFYGVNDKVQNELPKATKAYRDAVDPLITELVNMSKTGSATFTSEQFRDQANLARASAAALWDLSVDTLDDLLNMRIAAWKGKQTRALYTSIVSVALLTVFAFLFIRNMNRNLVDITEQVTSEFERLSAVAIELEEMATTLSESTTESAASITETVASIEEISAMLAQTGQHATSSLDICENGVVAASEGRNTVSRMSTAMNDISKNAEQINGITAIIAEIQNRTQVINDIVFETRILSFNASIEAARAGAHGKGFAVVAEEVGKLAALSGRAADEIKELLERSGKQVSSTVKGTEERIKAGSEVVRDCELSFQRMGSALERVAEAVRGISSASKEQDQGIRQVTQAMTEMDKVTSSTSASSEKMSTEAQGLKRGAEALGGTVSQMRQLVFGKSDTKKKAA